MTQPLKVYMTRLEVAAMRGGLNMAADIVEREGKRVGKAAEAEHAKMDRGDDFDNDIYETLECDAGKLYSLAYRIRQRAKRLR